MESTIIIHQFIDLNYINLMAGEDELMKKLMLEMLLEEVPREVEKMYQFYDYKEWDELRRVSHKMKMLLAFIGNDLWSSTNRELELVLKLRSNLEKLPDLFAILDNIYPKVLEELRAEYEGIEALV